MAGNFNATNIPDIGDLATTFAIFMNRVIDITFYGSDNTGVPLTVAVLGAIVGLAPPPPAGAPGAPAAPAAPVIPAGAPGARTDGIIEGALAMPVNLAVAGTPSCGAAGAGGGPPNWAGGGPAPIVERGTLGSAGGYPTVGSEGYRLAILQFMYNNYDIPAFNAIPIGFSARVYYAAFRLHPLIATFGIANIGPLYKEMLISLFLAFIKNIAGGAGAVVAAAGPLLNALTEFSKVNNIITANNNLGTAPAGGLLIMPHPYNQKYLKYKQKYLTLKNEKNEK